MMTSYENAMKFVSLPICACLLLGGCDIFDLIDDVAALDVCTAEQRLDIDTSDLGLNTDQSATLPSIDCQGKGSACDQLETLLGCADAAFPCSAQCGSGGTCELILTVDQSAPVDISGQVSNRTEADLLGKITFDRLEYRVPSNTLGFDTPSFELHVGQAEGNIGDEGVELLGRIPAVPAGETVERTKVPSEEAGRERFGELVTDYLTPFSMIGRSTLRLAAGDDLSTGKVEMRVRTCFEAQLL